MLQIKFALGTIVYVLQICYHFNSLPRELLVYVNYCEYRDLAPEGQSSPDGATLAATLAVSDDAPWRDLLKEGIAQQRMRSGCVSTDPECAAKAAGGIGLCLGAPSNAIIPDMDEKPSIQALQRKKGCVQTSSDKVIRGIKSTYKRYGTANRFAAGMWPQGCFNRCSLRSRSVLTSSIHG